MAISALQTPQIDKQNPVLVSVGDSGGDSNGDSSEIPGAYGYEQWLVWVQNLLKAHALTLYRIDTCNVQMELHALSSFPASNQSTASAHDKVAMRCAKTCTMLRVTSDTQANYSLVCIPDVDRAGKLARHVLVIERRALTKLDPQTQTKLMLWAFSCLGKFPSDRVDFSQANPLSRFSLTELERFGTLNVAFSELMNKLQDISCSDRCLIARLVIKNKRVHRAKLIALSGQQSIDGRLAASDSLVLAIENSYRDKTLPLYPDHQRISTPSITMQAPISSTLEQCTRLILPVCISEIWYAVCLERSTDKPFGKAEQSCLTHDLSLALPLLIFSDPQDRGVKASCKRQWHRLIQQITASAPRTAVVLILSVIALMYLLLPVEHRISAPLSVEASEKHVLIAPVDGFVESVAVNAGDNVEKGKVLATLDDLDLRLQQQKLQSEARQNQQAYAKALALHDRVEITRLKEEASIVQTELSQLQLQRDRMVLVAPVDGMVLSGRLDDFLGAAVSMGDALFTLGSANSHRLVLEVSEYDVKDLLPGQHVGIRMSADPSNVLLGSVTDIMPLAVAKDGVNSVQVHAALSHDAQLRPGMQGLGKVLVGRQARLVQWFKRASARIVWLGWRLGVLK